MISVMLCAIGLQAQTRTIHGTVLDASNQEPLIGATIMPIGGGNGAAADIDGHFTITVPANVKKAQVSYVGFTTKQVELTPNMTVYLDASSTSLDDVVVVAYGTATKESLTGSVAVVGSKDIEDRPVTSVTSALEGNAPGVQVNNSVGTPGSEPEIRIRGFNSINGVNSPLYVVDGIPYDGSIADINPADIESMSVLKDAASAALYGNKGANGVILITTKKAKNVGQVDVTLQVRQGMYTKGIPNYDRLGAADWMQIAFNGYTAGNVSNGSAASLAEAINTYRGNFISAYAKSNVFGVPDSELFDATGRFVGGNPLPGYTDLDWWDAVSVSSGYRQEYNVNAAAATEKFNIFASVGYLKEHGYTLRTDFERFNARVNANYNPTSYLKFGINLAAVQQENELLATTSGSSQENIFNTQSMAPIYPYYQHDADGNILYDDNGQPLWNEAGYLGGTNIGYTARADESHNSATVVDGSIYGTAVIPYGFELTVRGTMHRDKTNFYSTQNKKMGSGAPAGGSIKRTYGQYNSHTFLQELNWSREYGLHHIDVLLHHENTTYRSDKNGLTAFTQMYEGNSNLSNYVPSDDHPVTINGEIVETHDESYLGRARYNYNQKYFGEFSVRRDGTSRFSKENRWGTFWSVGASWIISKEKFMQNLVWMDYLKLRTAYGSVGNCMSASAYAYMSLYASTGLPIDGNYAIIPAQLAANNVKWEATKTFDIALEGSLFNERLGFSVGFFNKVNSDLLFSEPKSLSSGTIGNGGAVPTVLTNVGTMRNTGWELSIYGDVLRLGDLTWSLQADATFLKNKITKLPDHRTTFSGTSIRSEGMSIYEFYCYPWAGVDQLTGQSLYLIDKSSYDYYSYDDNSQLVFDEDVYNQQIETARAEGTLVEYDGKLYTTNPNYAGRVSSGTSLPTVYGSFGTNLTWKGLSVGALFTYSLGGKTLDSNYASYMSVGDSPSALHVDMLKAWQQAPEGMTADSPNRIDPNGVPQANTYLGMYSTTGWSTRFLTSSDYLVFKNLNVSYELPRKWTAPLQLKSLNVGVSIDNLFTLTKRTGMNPQQSFSGTQGTTFVTARVYSFQLTARF